jgi:hypothetical protein
VEHAVTSHLVTAADLHLLEKFRTETSGAAGTTEAGEA